MRQMYLLPFISKAPANFVITIEIGQQQHDDDDDDAML